MAYSDNYHVCPGRDHCPPAAFPPVLAARGWECPRCQKVHAPSVLSCPCSDSLRDRIRRGMAGRS
jgi:hypothetical protein